MKLFGIWTLFVALSISAVAAYYSIVGLTAIFAAAVVPVIIMAAVLEIGKINTAVLLHINWHSLPRVMKAYLTFATAVLMFITSMGIFGFLSSAHIEQTASGQEQQAALDRIETDIAQLIGENQTAREDIERLENSGSDQFQDLQTRLTQAREQIDRELTDIEPEIEQQRNIINEQQSRNESRIETLRSRIDELRQEEEELDEVLDELIERNYITRSQQVRQEQQPKRERLSNQRDELRNQIDEIQSTTDPIIAEARDEISRLREQARERASAARQTVEDLQNRISGETADQEAETRISEIENEISTRRDQIRELEDQKFEVQAQLRKLETEVGPVRYVAELVYGNDDNSTIEDAVRWVIVILVAVFDPFAIVLVISGVWMITRSKNQSPKPESSRRVEPTIELDDDNDNKDGEDPKKKNET